MGAIRLARACHSLVAKSRLLAAGAGRLPVSPVIAAFMPKSRDRNADKG